MWSYLTRWHVQFIVFGKKIMSDDDINDSSSQFNGYHTRRSKYLHNFSVFSTKTSFFYFGSYLNRRDRGRNVYMYICIYFFEKREVGKSTTETCFHGHIRDEKSCKSPVSERHTIQEKNTLNSTWILEQTMWADLQYVKRIRFEIRV